MLKACLLNTVLFRIVVLFRHTQHSRIKHNSCTLLDMCPQLAIAFVVYQVQLFGKDH